jgi:heat shock protein HslJ
MMNGGGRTRLVFQQEVQWRSDPAKLVGTSWMLRSTDGRQPLQGSVPTVRFETDKKVFWYDGCENFEGQYSVTENDLMVPSFGVVDRGCMKPEAFADPEGPCVVACFGPEGDYRLRDGLLEIRTEAGESTSVLEPIPEGEEPKQKGTPWELRYFVENGEKIPVVGEAPITLTFDRGTLRREGKIFGSTGCNDYRAAYEYPTRHNTLERIVVDDPVSTRRACPKSQRLVAQEQRFLAVVGDLGEYPSATMGGQLTLETRDGRKLIFSAPE